MIVAIVGFAGVYKSEVEEDFALLGQANEVTVGKVIAIQGLRKRAQTATCGLRWKLVYIGKLRWCIIWTT